ncbi:unnamed protein product [Moneuplotes crassus]|uniref:F-box domain-containing protein n=1 Tax=Euplotes crassus TaxID=5936 RepID=A0AAD1X6S3_EUPCR|nr:unnamed protein product [Moneuplotes crassus]
MLSKEKRSSEKMKKRKLTRNADTKPGEESKEASVLQARKLTNDIDVCDPIYITAPVQGAQNSLIFSDDILEIIYSYLRISDVHLLSLVNTHYSSCAKRYFSSNIILKLIKSNSSDFTYLIENPQIVRKHQSIMHIKDIIRRDFGNKIDAFLKRVCVSAEIGDSLNTLCSKTFKIRKRKGYLFKSFKIKPLKENNNFFSVFSFEKLIQSSFLSLTELCIRECIRFPIASESDLIISNGTPHSQKQGELMLFSKLCNLKVLDISDNKSVNDQTIAHICCSCPQLESINISSCNSVTEKSIIMISKRLHQLEQIDFSYCYNIRPGSVTYLFANRKTNKIDTIIANQIAFNSIDFRDINPNLKVLSVNGCEFLDDSFLSLISKSQLRELDIRKGINGMSQSSYSYSCQGILKLLERLQKTLKVFYMDYVYNIAFKNNAEFLKYMSFLRVAPEEEDFE